MFPKGRSAGTKCLKLLEAVNNKGTEGQRTGLPDLEWTASTDGGEGG